MCRSIKTLHNFRPPTRAEEIRASALQFVRKLSGFTSPSKANELAFTRAVDQVSEAARSLLDSLVTTAPPRDGAWRRRRLGPGRRNGGAALALAPDSRQAWRHTDRPDRFGDRARRRSERGVGLPLNVEVDEVEG
jgi:hypothetical protein